MSGIICIEEHASFSGIDRKVMPGVLWEAPYMRRVEDGQTSSPPRDPNRPVLLSMTDANALGADLGESRLRVMDEQGIQMQVLSWSSPTRLMLKSRAVDLARKVNDALARAVAHRSDRLSGFAALPWQSPDAAADELDRAVNELGFKGALIIGRPGKHFLDHPRYLPVFAKLNALGVPLYIHPFVPLPAVQRAYYGGFSSKVSARLSLFGWGWHNEASVQMLRMILAGLFDRFPNLKVVSGHWGEMLPPFLPRLDDALPASITGLQRSIGDTYRAHVWVTPSGMLEPALFRLCLDMLGPITFSGPPTIHSSPLMGIARSWRRCR